MDTVERFDFVPLGKAKRTPQGFLRFDANLTRVGVLEYRNADGSTRRELRHPDEVFKRDSLDTLSSAPVTEKHDVGMISPKNIKGNSIGHVSEHIDHGDQFVTGSVIVQDEGAISKVGSGESKELSTGYSCGLDWTPGVWNDEKYDAIQRNIRYNHVGLGPEGWGRAGSDVALRLDGDAAASALFLPKKVSKTVPKEEKATMKIRIDGVEFDLGTEASAAAQAFAQYEDKIDGQIKELTEGKGKAEGRADAAEAKVKEQDGKLVEATDPKRMDAAIEERAELLSAAREILDADTDLKGKTPREIKEAVLVKLNDSVKLDGKDDGYVDGAYEFAIANFQPEDVREDGNGKARMFTPAVKPPKKDEDRQDSKSAREKMVDHNQNLWKTNSRKDSQS